MALRVPYLNPVTPAASAPQGSAAVATRTAQAAGQLAGVVGGLVDNAWQQNEQIQQIENEGRLSDLQAQMQNATVEFQNKIAQDRTIDPAQWNQIYQQEIQKAKGGLNIEMQPPAVRQAFQRWSTGFEAKENNRISRDATLFSIERANVAASNNLKMFVQREDYDGAIGYIDELNSLTPEEKEARKIDIRKMQTTALLDQDIALDPRAARERLEARRSDGAWQFDGGVDGIDPATRKAKINEARRAEIGRSNDFVDTVSDGIVTGQIQSPEDIDAMNEAQGNYASPTVAAKLKDSLLQFNTERAEAARKTPEYQAQTVGQISSMMDGIATSEDFADRYATASFLTASLEESPMKRKLAEQLQTVKQGRDTQVKSVFDQGEKALKDAYTSGQFGPVRELGPFQMATSRAINDGFLTDRNRMREVGYSGDQSKEIIEAKDDKTRLELFRKMWRDRAEKKPLEGMTGAIAEAILNGSEQIEFYDLKANAEAAKAKVAAQEKLGQVQIQFSQWANLNPNASAADVDKKIFELSKVVVRTSATSEKFGMRPTRASSGDRITSYGYKGDTTWDENSSFGIGAWVSDKEQAEIKAGKQTPNRLRKDDLAVSRDIERQFQEAGIKPGDTVTIELDDGTKITSRWMDRTAESYNGKTLTGRFDLYSPDGESPLNGRRVVGWARSGNNRNTGQFEEYNVR